jgi:aldehyde:ferredoxin oxidoreductase
MKGLFNKIFAVNLNDRTHQIIEIADEIYENYLGGRGLGVKLFTDRVSPTVEPLSPDNKLVFTIGPVTGTSVSTSGRMSLVTKSPLTGTIFYSNTGGIFGFSMKRCGIDGIIIEGKSDKPCYIVIDDDKGLEIKDADELWGLDTTSGINYERCQQSLWPWWSGCCFWIEKLESHCRYQRETKNGSR